MKKNHTEPTPVSLADILEENSTIAWLAANGRNLLLGMAGALVLAIAAYKMAFAGAEKSEYTFISAENDYRTFVAKNDIESLQKLNAIITAHPELHAKYDAPIAQQLIYQGNAEEALPYAKPALKRTAQENAPLYSSFSEGSLLIGVGKYEEALVNALALKNLMTDDELLYGLNLIRIGMLQQKLSLKKDEAELWKEWKKYAALKQNTSEFARLMLYFQEGKISLPAYIEARERVLEKS